jgi:hypothetical protein
VAGRSRFRRILLWQLLRRYKMWKILLLSISSFSSPFLFEKVPSEDKHKCASDQEPEPHTDEENHTECFFPGHVVFGFQFPLPFLYPVTSLSKIGAVIPRTRTRTKAYFLNSDLNSFAFLSAALVMPKITAAKQQRPRTT